MPQETETKNKKTCLPAGREKAVFLKTVSLAWGLGYSIAIPIVALAFLGRFLDKKYETSPFILLFGIFLAMIISGAMVFRKTKKILEEAGKNN